MTDTQRLIEEARTLKTIKPPAVLLGQLADALEASEAEKERLAEIFHQEYAAVQADRDQLRENNRRQVEWLDRGIRAESRLAEAVELLRELVAGELETDSRIDWTWLQPDKRTVQEARDFLSKLPPAPEKEPK